ncbi:MAG: M3 family oligoendopeptidase [Acidobacteriota bacterium]|nr:M3 family oligoendopeptidase [Acidobacteriota bacterium]
MTQSTLPRESIAAQEQTGWDLGDLLPEPSEEVLSAELDALRAETEAFEARRKELSPEMDPAVFLDLLQQYEQLLEHMVRVEAYGLLWFSADTQSPDALTFRNRVEQLLTALNNRILFFILWWKELSDEQAERLLPGEDQADYRFYLQDRRRWKPFMLDEAREQLINLKDSDGISGMVTLYSMLTNRLEYQLEIDGESRTFTRDGLMTYAYSSDPDQRAAAYQELYRVYADEVQVLSQIYTYRVRDWHNEQIGLRGFSSPIAVRNTQNDVPDSAVDLLLDVVRDNRGLFQRFFHLKARWLGPEQWNSDRLRRYDIYAPLEPSDREIPWSEATSLVLDTFKSFDPVLERQARRVFEQRHIDSEIRKGKRGGAFCSTVTPELTPWVLVNYTGRIRDVAELAHELGHAVHSMLAEEHSLLTQNPSLPLAETASVFAEMLVTDRLLAREKNPAVRREMLAKTLSDIYATVLRQAYFVRFELEAHRAILEGRPVSELNRLYMENLQDQFGDSVELSDEFQYEWISIPHIFHTPFYCYAYSFGQLLVLALYRRYQQEGDAFKPSYLRLLAHGGSARPQEIMQEAGFDLTDRAFWQQGFEVVRELLDELESLEGQE